MPASSFRRRCCRCSTARSRLSSFHNGSNPMSGSRDSAHFTRIYQSNPDPWGFRTDPYEQDKYRHSIEVLSNYRFSSGLEVGCSIGVLTQMLALKCDTLLALDI